MRRHHHDMSRKKETFRKGHSSGTIRLQKRGLPSGPLQGHSLPGHFLIEEGNNATTTQRRPHPPSHRHISKCSSQAREGHGKRHKSGRSPVYSNHLTSIIKHWGARNRRSCNEGPQCTSPMITLGRIGTRSWTWYAQSCWNGMEYKKSQRMQGERNLEGDRDDSAQRWGCRYRRACIILRPNPRSRFRSSVRSCSCTNGLSIT